MNTYKEEVQKLKIYESFLLKENKCFKCMCSEIDGDEFVWCKHKNMNVVNVGVCGVMND
jgi:hypothetical protein